MQNTDLAQLIVSVRVPRNASVCPAGMERAFRGMQSTADVADLVRVGRVAGRRGVALWRGGYTRVRLTLGSTFYAGAVEQMQDVDHMVSRRAQSQPPRAVHRSARWDAGLESSFRSSVSSVTSNQSSMTESQSQAPLVL